MKRNLPALTEREHDLLIIGGGIFGACAAWDAVLRGLSVALIERGDFASATSANSFKMIHGGIRYLQHGDIVRLRQSSNERRAMLRIAPHLVHPLPIAIPTFGRGMKSKSVLRAGTRLYDWTACDRNRGIKDPSRRIPAGRCVSRQQVLDLFPGLKDPALTGAVLFHDAQMYNPSRLVLAFLQSATSEGAVAANYVEATRFLRKGDRVTGVEARDNLTDNALSISAKIVLNAAGPYAETMLQRGADLVLKSTGTYSRDACFVVKRRLVGDCSLAVLGRTSDPDAVFARGARHLFIVPWREYTLVGVWHVVHEGSPDDFTVTDAELQAFLDEVNTAYPTFGLELSDISMWHAGLVPFGENKPGETNLRYGKRSRLIDHAREHGLDGLVTLIGVRYTTARGEAANAIDLVARKLGKTSPKPTTHCRPIHGGHIDNIESFTREAVRSCADGLVEESIRALVRNHGSAYHEVLSRVEEDTRLADVIGSSSVLKAEVVQAVREEMAVKLADVVLRRTNLGPVTHPGDEALETCADLMAAELGWSESRRRDNLAETKAILTRRAPTRAGCHGARPDSTRSDGLSAMNV